MNQDMDDLLKKENEIENAKIIALRTMGLNPEQTTGFVKYNMSIKNRH